MESYPVALSLNEALQIAFWDLVQDQNETDEDYPPNLESALQRAFLNRLEMTKQ